MKKAIIFLFGLFIINTSFAESEQYKNSFLYKQYFDELVVNFVNKNKYEKVKEINNSRQRIVNEIATNCINYDSYCVNSAYKKELMALKKVYASELSLNNDVLLQSGYNFPSNERKFYDDAYKEMILNFTYSNQENSLKIMSMDNMNLKKEILLNCKRNDSQCINSYLKKGLSELKKNYYDVESLKNKILYPIDVDPSCYKDQALIFIDTQKKQITFYKKCNSEKVVFKIVNIFGHDPDMPLNYMLIVNGDMDGDGEKDKSFIFTPIGKRKWVIITNGDMVYGREGSHITEISIGKSYKIRGE